MRERNTSTGKFILFGVLFMVTAVITFISMNYQSEVAATTTMTEATLPIVMMETENNTLFNRMYGYTCELEKAPLDMQLTPLPADRKLPVVIDTYGQEITALSYKVRNEKDLSLIENTEVSDFQTTPEQVRAKLNIKNLIEDNTPYILELAVTTRQHEKIYYYTRMISGTDYSLQDKIDFVLEFNHDTFDPASLSDIAKYIETSKSGNNSNFGKVNINSTQAQIGWGDLDPFVESNIVPSVLDVNGDVAIIVLEYTMGAANDYDSFDTYAVHEYYRIRQTKNGMYLLQFEREASQLFDSRNDLLTSGKINLGIQPDDEVTALSSADNNFTYFVNMGTLWCYDTKQNAFVKVFSFESEDGDNVRERYNHHRIKIMSVEDSGTCNFLVYGYMNRGAHEGDVGISMCTYNYTDNEVTERLYIPVNMPYELLLENVGDVAYVTSDNVFYILIDGTLYAIELSSKEVMTAVNGLLKGSYDVSANGQMIAYSMNGSLYDTNSIRIFNMEQGQEHVIQAEVSDRLRVLGYINNDLIYGIAHAEDILTESSGTTTFPMYALHIMDADYQVIKDYGQEGIYVSGAEVDGQRINLTRVVSDGAGGYTAASIDQLINRDENVVTGTVAETITTVARKQETVLVLVNAISGMQNVSMKSAREVAFSQNGFFELPQKVSGQGKYYVHGCGLYFGGYENAAKAVRQAYEHLGTVKDCNGKLVWKRFKNASGSIKGLSSGGCSQTESLAVSTDILMRYAGYETQAQAAISMGQTVIEVMDACGGIHGLNLKGVSVEQVLSFVSEGYPVIGGTEEGYVIITAYDSEEIVYLDTKTGAEKTVKLSDAVKLFSEGGNVFITYYKG